jgi:hypothetical protein
MVITSQKVYLGSWENNLTRLASVALIGLSTEVSDLRLICSLRKQRELLRLGLLPTVSGLRLIYGKRRRWRAGSGRNERMVRRHEEKRRKRFANRAWACRSSRGERQPHARFSPLPRQHHCRSSTWGAAKLKCRSLAWGAAKSVWYKKSLGAKI